LTDAGVLLDAAGLQRSAKGWRIKYTGRETTLVDGPFAETKELAAGYTIIQVNSKQEAIEWTKRYPNPSIDGKQGEIEVRPLFELEDFGPGEAIERFRDMQDQKATEKRSMPLFRERWRPARSPPCRSWTCSGAIATASSKIPSDIDGPWPPTSVT
jgi:hypothetical protein